MHTDANGLETSLTEAGTTLGRGVQSGHLLFESCDAVGQVMVTPCCLHLVAAKSTGQGSEIEGRLIECWKSLVDSVVRGREKFQAKFDHVQSSIHCVHSTLSWTQQVNQ